MKLIIPEREPLVLDVGCASIKTESGKFDAKTSYASKLVTRLGQKAYRNQKLPLKLGACLTLLKRIQRLGGHSSYFEPLAGVGLSARLFDSKGRVFLNDMDTGCQAVLRTNFPAAEVSGEDANTLNFPSVDLVFLDFNNFTMKRYLRGDEFYVNTMERAFSAAKKFVVVNDCSPFYFRYGVSAFENYSKLLNTPLHTVEEYLVALREFYKRRYRGWFLIHASYFTDSSFQLFAKKSEFLKVERAFVLPVSLSEGLLA